MLSIIVAVAENNAIGFNNQLLCHLPNDLKRFKQITSGKTVIMGRNTYLSLPKGALPNRRNIVITDKQNETFDGCEMVYSIQEAVEKCNPADENFIMGGAMIYKQFFGLVDKLYITEIHHAFEADTFFPEISLDVWCELKREPQQPDEKHKYAYSFVDYVRK